MGDNSNSFRFKHDDTVPTVTIGAAFILAVILGLIVVSGVLLKPYEAREVVSSIHEKIMMEKEYRELSKINYSPSKVAFSKPDGIAFAQSNNRKNPSYSTDAPTVTIAVVANKKTDRAQSFDHDVKSDKYWQSLQASVSGVTSVRPGSAPVVLPTVVVGSAQ